MLWWHKELWLIDHGAGLYVHHAWHDWDNNSFKPFPNDQSVPQQSPGNGDAAHACADNQDPQRHASERAPQAFPPHAERLRRIRPVRTGASRLWHHSAVFGGDS